MKVRSASQWVLAIVAGLMMVAAANAQSYGSRNRPGGGGSGTITGKVWMPDGTAAVGVKVLLNSTDLNTSTYTDADGMYAFGSLRGGSYTVSVKEAGYEQETASYSIDEDSGSARSISLPLYLRNPGQKKGDFISGNPLFKGVPKDAVSRFEKGMDKLAKNDVNGALAEFEGAATVYPNFAAANYEKGGLYLKLNEPDKAIESFVKAISIKQDYLEAKYGYGLAQLQKKNYEVAAAAFNDVVQTRKDMAEAHMNLGVSLYYIKNIAAAESELKAAAAAKGGENLALIHLYLGQIYSQKKKNADAVAELQKYVEMAPKAPNVDRIKLAIEDLKKQPVQ